MQLTLFYISFSVDGFHRLLSGCHALESLDMSDVRGVGCLHVSSRTLRSIGFHDSASKKAELVIEDAPRLVRLLLPFGFLDYDCVSIRVIRVPKLEILGPFLPVLSKLLVSQEIHPISFANCMRTVKVLSLRSFGLELDAVLNILGWFPFLEKLYIIFHKHKEMNNGNEHRYDPLHPIECLETHLKKVVFKSFVGHDKQVNFPTFFILNAKVLKKLNLMYMVAVYQ
uniref:FBD domain-containing protein n=1 Tax=Triticum urartu TaxID=4572 RepID=A0A8R7UQ13_TRIUA